MIGSTRTVRVWAYPAPADLRKGFDGVQALVAAQLARDACDLPGFFGPLGPALTSALTFKNHSVDRNDTLIWKWTKGAATSPEEFADPRSTAEDALCIYGGSSSTLRARIYIRPSDMWSTYRRDVEIRRQGGPVVRGAETDAQRPRGGNEQHPRQGARP